MRYLLISPWFQIFELATNRPLFSLETFDCTPSQIQEQYRCKISETLDAKSSASSLETILHESLSTDFGSKDEEMLGNFVHCMLKVDPSNRYDCKR